MDREIPSSKRCVRCGEEKPRDAFHPNRQNRTGLCSYCKPCGKLAKRRDTPAARRLAERKALLEQKLARCVGCGATRSIDAFYMKDGRPLAKCKECTLDDGRSQRLSAQARASRRAYLAKPEVIHAAKQRRAAYASAEENKQKLRARKYTHKAIKKGLLKRKPCETCGAEPAHAHHHKGYDLANRLDVQWLCVRCHMQHHAKAS